MIKNEKTNILYILGLNIFFDFPNEIEIFSIKFKLVWGMVTIPQDYEKCFFSTHFPPGRESTLFFCHTGKFFCFCKDSLTLNNVNGKRRFQSYYLVLAITK